MAASLSFPIARQDPFSPPQEYAALRRDCPITKVKLFDGSEAWLLSRREDCCAALESTDLSADRRHPAYPEIHEGGAKAKEQRPTFVNLDNPAHDEQRALIEPWFTKEATLKLQPMMQAVVDENIDRLVKEYGKHTEQPVDFIHAFAGVVPPQIIYYLLGIPERDIPALSRDNEVRTSTSRNAAETSNTSLRHYMKAFVEKRQHEPQNDLVSTLVAKTEPEDAVELAFLVLVAGNAALINSIALGVITLLQHPEQLAELKKDPSLASKVVDELLRFNTTSALNCRRVVKTDSVIGDQHMEANDKVICAVQSADRDEAHFEDPQRFDIRRTVKSEDVLGFGWGPHRCQGEWLTRQELEIVFSMSLRSFGGPADPIGTLWHRLPDLRLAVNVQDLRWTDPTQNMGVTEMAVVW